MADVRQRRRREADGAVAPPPGAPLPLFLAPNLWLGLDETRRRLGDAVAAEFAAGAGLPALAIVFALGAALYAVAPSEPSVWALGVTAVIFVAATVWRRLGGHDARVLAACAALALGAVLAKLESDRAAAPRLDHDRTATVTGWIADAEATPRNGRRMLVAVAKMEARGLPPDAVPRLITVTARGAGRDLPVGAGVSFLARLRPPDGPTIPGGYDFARRAWFEGRGGSGFVLGKVTAVSAGPAPVAVRLNAPIANLRAAVADRVRAALPGPAGTVAAALMVGEARAIPESVNASMRTSGLYHIISISGLHMTLVAGGVFWVARLLLALAPGYAARHNGKKPAAILAVIAAGFYLLLSGGGVATLRSFLMFAVALVAVIADRPAVTRATVAVTVILVVALWPSSVVEPGFLMSFLAVAALVATFELWQGYVAGQPAVERPWAARFARGAALWLAGAALTSLVAGAATAPVVIDAFHRAAPYGVLANLAALPLVGLIIMPMAMLAGLALPFGLEVWPLKAMGWGIDAMLWVSDVVAGLPGGGGLVGAIHPLAAPLAVTGLLWLVLWRSRLRLIGLAPIAVALALAPLAPRVDILVADDGKTVAVRGADGLLTLTGAKDNTFAAATWLLADADSRDPRAASVAAGWRCDADGCEAETGPAGTGPAGKPALIVLNRTPADLPVDCRRARVLVTPLPAPRACAETTLLLDRPTLAASGSIAIDLAAGTIRVANASRRPWTAGRADPEHPVAWPAPAAEAPPVYRPPDPSDTPDEEDAEADAVSRAPP